MTRFKIAKVIVEKRYLIPMQDNSRTELDGRTVDAVVQEWFYHHDLNGVHITRDGHHMSGQDTVIEVDVEDYVRE